jgi:hypothetical protein
VRDPGGGVVRPLRHPVGALRCGRRDLDRDDDIGHPDYDVVPPGVVADDDKIGTP